MQNLPPIGTAWAARLLRGAAECVAVAIFSVVACTATPKEVTAAAPAEYRIGPGDILNIEVGARRDLSGRYPVGADGNVFMPPAGSVAAAGKTPTELSSDLSRRLSLFDRDISQVSVSIAEAHGSRVFVMGAVLRPGKYSFTEAPTAWEAIGEAGGPTEDAQLAYVEVIPGDSTVGRGSTLLDLGEAVRTGRVGGLPRLRPGDTVRVPRVLSGAGGMKVVYVLGAVATQGAVSFDQARDVMGAVLHSGGFAPDADLSHVEIVRRNATGVVRLKAEVNAFLARSNQAGNPPLAPGDAVYVPRLRTGRSWLGIVVRDMLPFVALATALVRHF